MRLTRFQTVRGRLLALLVAIAFPIACLTGLAAFTTYNTVVAAIELAQARTADDFAVRTRVWHRGAVRVLLASGQLIATATSSGQPCRDVTQKMLERIPGYRAARFVLTDGRVCFAAKEGITETAIADVSRRLQELPRSQTRSAVALPPARFDQVKLDGVNHLATHFQLPADPVLREALLLADPDLLDQVFELGGASDGVNVALVSGQEAVVMHRGERENDDLSWLPADTRFPVDGRRWEAQSRAGQTRFYAVRLVSAPDLYVIASFSNAPERAARMQFLALLIAPIMTLILLCLVYLRAIDQHCVQWLRGIEAAARARSREPNVRAAIADGMPSDIRSVAEAFNTMVDEQEVRQRRLQTALDDNRFLVRELHHRVKNSLQVVQSYIGLRKREYRDEAREALADAETRVHVLSAAYRFTLADGEMQPVRVDLFLEDVVTMIGNIVRGRDQWVSTRLDTVATLSVDRIIPLGFLVVDVTSRVLRSTPGVSLTIIICDVDATTLDVSLEADRPIIASEPPKMFAGLVAQIEAVQVEKAQGRSLGRWRINHRT